MKLNRIFVLGLSSIALACGSTTDAKQPVPNAGTALDADGNAAQTTAPAAPQTTAPAAAQTAPAPETPATPVDNTPADTTIASLAVATPSLSTLVSLLKLCDLVGAVANKEASLTVFAPTNDAFGKFLKDQPAPTECSPAVKNILLYHVLGSKVTAGDLAPAQAVPSLLSAKDKLFVTKSESGVTVNGGSKVVLADVLASNGVVHVVDTVLIPDALGTVVNAAAKRYDLSTLVSAVVGAGLADALTTTQGITVFAPVNSAFGKLSAVPAGNALVRVLKEHVIGSVILAGDLKKGLNVAKSLNGTKVTVSVAEGVTVRGSGDAHIATPANVIETDIVTSNGVIHLIDSVLTPASH